MLVSSPRRRVLDPLIICSPGVASRATSAAFFFTEAARLSRIGSQTTGILAMFIKRVYLNTYPDAATMGSTCERWPAKLRHLSRRANVGSTCKSAGVARAALKARDHRELHMGVE